MASVYESTSTWSRLRSTPFRSLHCSLERSRGRYGRAHGDAPAWIGAVGTICRTLWNRRCSNTWLLEQFLFRKFVCWDIFCSNILVWNKPSPNRVCVNHVVLLFVLALRNRSCSTKWLLEQFLFQEIVFLNICCSKNCFLGNKICSSRMCLK